MWRPEYDFMEFFSLSTSACVLGSKLRVSGLHTWAARLTFWAVVPILNGFYGWVIPPVPMIEPRTACVLIKSSTTELHHWWQVFFFNYLFGNMWDLCCFMAHMWLSEDNLAESKFFSTMWVPGLNLGGQTWWHMSLQYGAISLALQIFF